MRKRIGRLTILEKVKDRNHWDSESYINTISGNKTYKKYAEKVIKDNLAKLGFSNIVFKSVSSGIRGEYYILGNYKNDKIVIQKQVIDYDIIFGENKSITKV